MEIRPGEFVIIRHYSRVSLYRSIVIDVFDDNFSLNLTKSFTVFDFHEGDPIVIGLEYENENYIVECSVVKVKQETNVIIVKMEHAKRITDETLSNSFPVSLHANIRPNHEPKRHEAVIKSVGFTRVALCCKESLAVGEGMCIEIYFDKKIIDIEALIKRKTERKNDFLYELKITFMDMGAQNSLKQVLQIFKNEQEVVVKK